MLAVVDTKTPDVDVMYFSDAACEPGRCVLCESLAQCLGVHAGKRAHRVLYFRHDSRNSLGVQFICKRARAAVWLKVPVADVPDQATKIF